MRKYTVFFLAATLVLSACNSYGDKVKKNHIEIYYKEGISKDQALATANLIYGIDSAAQNDMSYTKSMQLEKSGDTVSFKMVVNQKKLEGVNDLSFMIIGMMLSDSIFSKKPVNVDLTDNKFKTFKTVRNNFKEGDNPIYKPADDDGMETQQ